VGIEVGGLERTGAVGKVVNSCCQTVKEDDRRVGRQSEDDKIFFEKRNHRTQSGIPLLGEDENAWERSDSQEFWEGRGSTKTWRDVKEKDIRQG